MRRLIFFVPGSGMIKVGKFVKSKFAVALRGADQVGFRPSIGGEAFERLHIFVTRAGRGSVAQSAIEQFLERGVEHSSDHAILESLVEITDWPQLVADPAGFD